MDWHTAINRFMNRVKNSHFTDPLRTTDATRCVEVGRMCRLAGIAQPQLLPERLKGNDAGSSGGRTCIRFRRSETSSGSSYRDVCISEIVLLLVLVLVLPHMLLMGQ